MTSPDVSAEWSSRPVSNTEPIRRNPLVIDGNSLSSGGRSTTFAAESPNSLLRSYLIFVRDMRGQRREPSIELRTDDVAVIASHLGTTEEYVLGGLLDLMGATRSQRSTMMAMLAAGALTVVLTGSFVSDLSNDGVSVDMTRLAEAVQAAATSSDTAAASTATAAQTARVSPAASRTPAAAARAVTSPGAGTETTAETTAATDTPTSRTTSETLRSELTHGTPRPDVLRSAAAATVAGASEPGPTESTGGQTGGEPAGSVVQEPVSIGIAPDGSLVGSAAPPVPATTDEPVATAELPDGSTVGVAAPPVPPPAEEQVATAELPDGTVVGVAAPPVPPPAEG